MRKVYLMLMLAFTMLSINAQTLLDEDFETTQTDTNYSRPVAKGDGWTTVDSYSGEKAQYNWVNYYSEKGTIGGTHVAACDGPILSDGDGVGPREEILLTPELDLTDTYQLSFDWVVSPMYSQAKSLYDFQVRIVENGDVDNAETVFSIQNEGDLKESGVMEYPITNWNPHTSKLDLSEWKGKKIKVAFVYKMLTTVANIVYLDNVSVKKFTPATTPVPSLSLDRYDFGKVYIGEKFYSEKFKLTNNGKSGLQITSVDLPEGVSMNIDPSTVNLGKYESTYFQFAYKASLTSPASAKVVLHTNGGDVMVDLTATKQVIPEGMTEETFETYFPPAGWKNEGWSKTVTALEGDVSAYASASLTDNYLTSPRLDLTNGGKVMFTYYNHFDSEEGGTYQNNDISLELSTNGGKTWTSKWTYDYTKESSGESLEIDLGVGTDNSYVRWHNTAISTSDDGVDEYADFYLDRIFLPTLYGQDGAPLASSLVAPADSTTEIYPKNIKLEWTPALFAEGYSLYVGTAENVYNVLDGQNVGDALTYTLPTVDYETTYYWKVVPYNTKGEAQDVSVWHFTTQKDASTADYPYVEDFSDNKIPTGWTTDGESQYNRAWAPNNVKGNPAPCLYATWLNAGEHISVTTQEFHLPANKTMAISFDWGDRHPTDLIPDESGIAKKENVEPDNGVEKLTFEIGVDGNWQELSYISQDWAKEEVNWVKETFDLGAYAGKTVQFRWTHYSLSGRDNGGAIDNVVIEEKLADKAIFNKSGWKAGKVNYGMAVNSGNQFTLINKGANALKIKKVDFATDNFSTSLQTGDEIAAGEGLEFNTQFNALTSATVVKDTLIVTFESGYQVQLPVEGTGLAQDVFYYSFEDNPLDKDWTTDFTLIDVDKAATVPFNCYGTEFPSNNGVYAFAVAYERPNHNNVAPISGDAFLIPGTPLSEDIKGDNWIVSQKLTANAGASLDFYARNWESNQSVIPSAKHQVEVLVSETGNTDRSAFTTVLPRQEIPFLDRENWNHYTVDLSAYAGKDVYVAVRDYNETFALAAFYDDFTFTHFSLPATGIGTVNAAIADNALVTVYTINGVQVVKGEGANTLKSLAKGIYVVKIQDGNGVRTLRLARK